jgi:hypothetical protein
MARATYQKSSVYYQTPQNNNRLGSWVPPSVQPSQSDGVLVVSSRYVRRPDLLSNDLYGTPQLWWVFAMVNPDLIKDPIYDLVDGMVIRYPNKNSIEGLI